MRRGNPTNSHLKQYPGVTLWLDGEDDAKSITNPDPVFEITTAGDARILGSTVSAER